MASSEGNGPYIYNEDPFPYQSLFDRLAMMAGRKSFEDAIDRFFTQAQNPVRILDLGYGKGSFLERVYRKYGNRVICTGIDSHPLATHIAGVSTYTGDVTEFTSYIPENSQDIITAANLAIWLPDPLKTLIYDTHKTLTRDGTCWVNALPMSQMLPNPTELNQFIWDTSQIGWRWFENRIWSPKGELGYDLLMIKSDHFQTIYENLTMHDAPNQLSPDISRSCYFYKSA
jgi:hypothetical protein